MSSNKHPDSCTPGALIRDGKRTDDLSLADEQVDVVTDDPVARLLGLERLGLGAKCGELPPPQTAYLPPPVPADLLYRAAEPLGRLAHRLGGQPRGAAERSLLLDDGHFCAEFGGVYGGYPLNHKEL